MHSELLQVLLRATDRKGDYILLTQYGRPFSPQAVRMRMHEETNRVKFEQHQGRKDAG
jgi:hypothetical protein